MSCVNLSEVLQKAEQHRADTEGLEFDLEALGVTFRPFDVPSARSTTALWRAGSGLPLGDRACLTLAAEAGGVAVTAEARWTQVAERVHARVIR